MSTAPRSSTAISSGSAFESDEWEMGALIPLGTLARPLLSRLPKLHAISLTVPDPSEAPVRLILSLRINPNALRR